MSENQNPESAAKNREQEVKDRRKALIVLREELDYLMKKDLEEESDPETIHSLIHLIRVYSNEPVPERFAEDKFLDRFNQKNSRGPYRDYGRFNKVVALWKNRRDPRLLPLKWKMCLTGFMLLFITIIALNFTLYARAQRETYLIQTYNDELAIEKVISGLYNNSKFTGTELKLNGVPEEYRGKIYLPLQLLRYSTNYQFYERNLKDKELFLSYVSHDKKWWLTQTAIIDTNDQICLTFGDSYVLQEDSCKWLNSKVYYNEAQKITTILFEIDSTFYIATSNIEKESLIKLIDQLEVYK